MWKSELEEVVDAGWHREPGKLKHLGLNFEDLIFQEAQEEDAEFRLEGLILLLTLNLI